MSKSSITFRVEEKKRRALDAIAKDLDRDRSYVLNEAIETYLEARGWQVEHIRKGLRQAEAGKFASDREVARALKRWR